jgi:hypothetical protein
MTLLAGAQAPERYEVTITNPVGDPSPLDFTTVSAVRLLVRTPRAADVVWPVTVVSQTTSTLVVRHLFELQDVGLPGAYQVLAELTVPDGIRRAGPAVLSVSSV